MEGITIILNLGTYRDDEYILERKLIKHTVYIQIVLVLSPFRAVYKWRQVIVLPRYILPTLTLNMSNLSASVSPIPQAGVQTNTCYTLLQVFKLTLTIHSCRRLSTSATVANGSSSSAGSSWTELTAPRLSSWSSRTCVSFWCLMTSCRRPFISTIFSTKHFANPENE